MLQNQLFHAPLREIRASMSVTNFGRNWPQPYKDFYALWSYFNGVYDFYNHPQEWARIALFSQDADFQPVAVAVLASPAVQLLMQQPCVGDGRNSFAPSSRVRTAVLTLHKHFVVNTRQLCAQEAKCLSRQRNNKTTCLSDLVQPAPQTPLAAQGSAEYGTHTPFGAILYIIYQIRCNLIHGDKHEYNGPEYDRNKFLVETGRDILEVLLSGIKTVLDASI